MIDFSILTIILVLVLLLALSGFFSASETGLTGSSKARLHLLSQRGNKRAKGALGLLEEPARIISVILFGNNLVNIFASTLAASLLIDIFGETNGVWLNTIIMTFLILLFSEILPKTYAIENSEKVALIVTPFIRFFAIIFSPFLAVIDRLVAFLLYIFNIQTNGKSQQHEREEELRGAIAMHEDHLEPETHHEKVMMRSILDLDEMDISAVMTHRSQISMIDVNMPWDEAFSHMRQEGFTRYPVYEEKSDNIIGIIHIKSLFRAGIGGDDNNKHPQNMRAFLTKPWFVPDSTSLLDQLQAFRAKNELFAIVVDEYGSVMGIVTLEDILEQIVGQINDEHDSSKLALRRQIDGGVIVDGTTAIRELNRKFDWHLPDDLADTIAGLVLYESRIVPNQGQIFEFHGYRIEILRKHRHQITSIRIKSV